MASSWLTKSGGAKLKACVPRPVKSSSPKNALFSGPRSLISSERSVGGKLETARNKGGK